MKRLPTLFKQILLIAGVLILVVMIVEFNDRLDEYNRLNDVAGGLRATATADIMTQTALQDEIVFATSVEAVETFVYGGGGMALPGDQSIGLVPGNTATPTPTLPAEAQATPVPKWMIWWELFFSDRK